MAPELIQVDVVADLWDRFDILHFHTGPSHYPLMSRMPVAHLTTMHGPLDVPGQRELYNRFNQIPLVSISESQRQPLPYANWLGNVYHGLPLDLYKPEY